VPAMRFHEAQPRLLDAALSQAQTLSRTLTVDSTAAVG